MAVALVDCQGGMKGETAMLKTSRFFQWADVHMLALSSVYGTSVKKLADGLPQLQTLNLGAWSLHPEVSVVGHTLHGSPGVLSPLEHVKVCGASKGFSDGFSRCSGGTVEPVSPYLCHPSSQASPWSAAQN